MVETQHFVRTRTGGDDWRASYAVAYGEDARRVFAHIEELLPHLGQEATVWSCLRRFLSEGGSPATELRSFAQDPAAVDLFCRLAVASAWGSGLVQYRPGEFWSVVQQRDYRWPIHAPELRRLLLELLSLNGDTERAINAVVRFQQRQFLRMMLGDLCGAMTLPMVARQLADLADTVVQAALDLVLSGKESTAGSFCVLAFGKLGGQELNYSSDIDLVFVYEAAAGVDHDDAHAWAVRTGRQLIRLLDQHHDAGRLYRVDMRLRPEGDSGELALSLRETRDYCWNAGRTWERQAWLKARPIAGDVALGERLLADLQGWIYPREHSPEDIEEQRRMRRRIEERSKGSDVKIGAGGIRDVEFLVQHYQLAFGGRDPALRVRSTLPALDLITELGVLTPSEQEALAEDYLWLRTVEHRLQMFEWKQLHELPTGAAERLALANRCGYVGATAVADFDADLTAVQARVRGLAERHFLASDHDDEAYMALVSGEGDPDPALLERVFAGTGLRDRPKAAARLRALATERFFVLSRGRTRQQLVALLPRLLPRLALTPDPDATLEHFQRIVDSVGGRAHFYRFLASHERYLRRILDLAGWAAYPLTLMDSHPGLADEVVERFFQKPLEIERLQADATDLLRGASEPAPQLARLQARELVHLAAVDLDGSQTAVVAHGLTALARALIRCAWDRAWAEQQERWGDPVTDEGQPFCAAVLGCGKLGSWEMTYASDVDLIFVCPRGGTCRGSERSGEDFVLRVAQRCMRMLDEGRLYEADPRLRPYGEQGELITTLPALRHYWERPREVWERLAMTRSDCIAGDDAIGIEALTIIRAGAFAHPLPDDARDQVRSMRQRLEDSVRGRDHLKRGWGGYVDIEFIAQFLALGMDPAQVPLGEDIPGLLRLEAEAGRLDAALLPGLTRSLELLRHLEARSRLYEGKAVSSIPTDAAGRARFARCAGYPDTAAMDLELHLARETARHAFDGVLADQ
jgi:glutamate-ammonia-ligase adenylyltransferase